ncbi:hypothetical protein B0H11DRAFT_2189657 [Mycena galericulata]|nr:hypothetical protein B0H11DRAFT_2189657 [Mycena galericulata]
MHDGVSAVVATFFKGQNSIAEKIEALFVPNEAGNLEATQPMVAIACAAIHSSLEDYSSGGHKHTNFEGSRIQEIYDLHIMILEKLKHQKPAQYHEIMEHIFAETSPIKWRQKHHTLDIIEEKWMEEGELGENDDVEDADRDTETPEMDDELLDMDNMEEEEDEATDSTVFFTPRAPKKRKVSFQVESDDDDEAVWTVTSKQKKTKQPPKSTLRTETNPKKRKIAEPPAEEPAAKKVHLSFSVSLLSLFPGAITFDIPKALKPEPRQRKQSSKPPSLVVWANLPNVCPTVMCDDPLPETRNEPILSLFVERQGLISEVGSRGPSVSFTELQICAAITQEKHREKYIELGKQNQWPQIIDYNTVPARILKLKDSLLKMIQDPDVLQTSFIWNDFISRIDSQIFKFASSASKLAFTDALYGRRCGYYGPKGEFLINSTLLRILSKEEEALSYKLYDTLSSIIDEAPDSFDEYDDTSNLT